MKRWLMVLGVVVALCVTWSVGYVQGQGGQPEKTELIFMSAGSGQLQGNGCGCFQGGPLGRL